MNSSSDQNRPVSVDEVLSGAESQAVEQMNTFLLDSTVQQNVNTLLQYFQLAYFLRKVAGMSLAEFEILCDDTKRLIRHGLGENNRKLQVIPDPVRSRAQMAGLLPETTDIVNAMRYFVEAKQLLTSLRVKSGGGDSCVS